MLCRSQKTNYATQLISLMLDPTVCPFKPIEHVCQCKLFTTAESHNHDNESYISYKKLNRFQVHSHNHFQIFTYYLLSSCLEDGQSPHTPSDNSAKTEILTASKKKNSRRGNRWKQKLESTNSQ